MCSHFITEPENAVSGNSHASPETQVPGSRLQERGPKVCLSGQPDRYAGKISFKQVSGALERPGLLLIAYPGSLDSRRIGLQPRRWKW